MNDPCEMCRKAKCPDICYAQRDFARHHGRTRYTRKNDGKDAAYASFVRGLREQALSSQEYQAKIREWCAANNY